MSDDTVNVRYIVDDVDRAVDFYTGHFGFVVGIHSPAFADVTKGASGCSFRGRRALPVAPCPMASDRHREAGTGSISSSTTSMPRSHA